MGLVHTCTEYGYMQAQTKDMHDLEQLFYNNMIMESQVSGLAKLGLGMLVNFPNFDYESHAMSVTCTIILMILYTTHKILHIAHILLHIEHNIFHIIHLYAMRPWNHGLDIKTSQNEGSMGPQLGSLLSQIQSLLYSFMCTSFSFFHILVKPPVIPRK